MKYPKKIQIQRKANEAQLLRNVRKACKLPNSWESLSQMQDAIRDDPRFYRSVVSLVAMIDGYHPWCVDVGAEVMSSDFDGNLISELLQFEGDIVLVQDTARSGVDGVWVVAANMLEACEKELFKSECRALVRNILFDGNLVKITAIQLSSIKFRE